MASGLALSPGDVLPEVVAQLGLSSRLRHLLVLPAAVLWAALDVSRKIDGRPVRTLFLLPVTDDERRAAGAGGADVIAAAVCGGGLVPWDMGRAGLVP